MAFKFQRTRILDVVLIEPQIFSDPRGFFVEMFKSTDFQANGLLSSFNQVSFACSKRDVLRGLHYQLSPKAQSKIVQAVRGEIFDVAVDIRRASPTYGQYVAERLSGSDHKMLFVPEGFAHGYCVLSEEAEVMYLCTGEYAPDLERTIRWNDPALAIPWPVKEPVLSTKDSGGAFLAEAQNNF